MNQLPRRQAPLWLCGFLLACASTTAWADSPSETFFIPASEQRPDLLRRAIGVLSLTIPTCEGELHHEPRLNEKMRRALACGDVASLPVVDDNRADAMHAQKWPFIDTRPFSGWDWTDLRVVRYPVVAVRGDDPEIVIDPKTLATIRIDRKAWSELPRPDFIDDVFKLLRFDHDRTFERYEEVAVSLLNLASGTRIFEQPSPEAPSFEARQDTGLPELVGSGETFGSMDGSLAIAEIRDGFARLVVLDPCHEADGLVPSLGWIQLRDENGRLTVWPQVGLSC